MAVFKGDETPYAQKQKEKASESAATLITSDAKINKPFIDYVISESHMQAVTQMIRKITDAYYLEDGAKVRLIEDLLEENENAEI